MVSLFVSEDGHYWEKYNRPIEITSGEELFSESVMTTYFSEALNWIWVGTGDGIGIIEDTTSTIFRFSEPANPFSAYPNPFLIDDINQVNGDGHVRFKYLNPNNELGTIDIFDFAMEKVIQLTHAFMIDSDESEIIWNGKNDYGDQVANGVYFCRLSLNNKYTLMHIMRSLNLDYLIKNYQSSFWLHPDHPFPYGLLLNLEMHTHHQSHQQLEIDILLMPGHKEIA